MREHTPRAALEAWLVDAERVLADQDVHQVGSHRTVRSPGTGSASAQSSDGAWASPSI